MDHFDFLRADRYPRNGKTDRNYLEGCGQEFQTFLILGKIPRENS